MSALRVSVGYSGRLFAAAPGRRWHADTPAELVAKLAADGIGLSHMDLIMADSVSCHDHALPLHLVEAFAEMDPRLRGSAP